MALYSVEIIMGDGERETVTVEADNIKDARAKAGTFGLGAETGSTIGLPVLQVAPTTTPAPTVAPVESYIDPTEWGDAIPSITSFKDFVSPAVPFRQTKDYMQEMGPKPLVQIPFTSTDQAGGMWLGKPQRPVTTVPTPPVTGFDPNIDPLINPDMFDPNAPLTPPGTGAFVPPVVTAPPPSAAPGAAWPMNPGNVHGYSTGGMYGDPSMTNQQPFEYQEPLPPAVVPPAVVPPVTTVPPTLYPEQFGPDVPRANGGVANGGTANGGAGGNGEVVIDPATGFPILTSREMIDDQVLRRAGMRRALQNVFGQQLGSGVGPLAGYLQRQAWPLSDAMTAGAYADMARAFARDRDLATLGGTAAGPQQFDYGVTSPSPTVDQLAQQFVDETPEDYALRQMEESFGTDAESGTAAAASGTAAGGLPAGYSFENFLRTTRDQPTGLGGAYGQALQDVSYLRGLGRDALPPVVQAAFDPGSADATADVAGLLGAAQRGRYSGLVSSRFRQPTQQDLFADYFLSKQDAAKAGTAPENFLNFAAQRYGL